MILNKSAKCHFCKAKLSLSNCKFCWGEPHFVAGTTVAMFNFSFDNEIFRAIYNWELPYVVVIDQGISNSEEYDYLGMSGQGSFTEYKTIYRGNIKASSAEELGNFVKKIASLRPFL